MPEEGFIEEEGGLGDRSLVKVPSTREGPEE